MQRDAEKRRHILEEGCVEQERPQSRERHSVVPGNDGRQGKRAEIKRQDPQRTARIEIAEAPGASAVCPERPRNQETGEREKEIHAYPAGLRDVPEQAHDGVCGREPAAVVEDVHQ